MKISLSTLTMEKSLLGPITKKGVYMFAFKLEFTQEDFTCFVEPLLEKYYRLENEELMQKIVEALFDQFLAIGGGKADWLLKEIQNLQIVEKDNVRNYLSEDDDYMVFTMHGQIQKIDCD